MEKMHVPNIKINQESRESRIKIFIKKLYKSIDNYMTSWRSNHNTYSDKNRPYNPNLIIAQDNAVHTFTT